MYHIILTKNVITISYYNFKPSNLISISKKESTGKIIKLEEIIKQTYYKAWIVQQKRRFNVRED